MKNRLPVFIASLAITSLFVCGTSLSATSGIDLVAAAAAVRKADAAWSAAAGTSNVDAWMAFYGADAIVRLPNEPLASGKEIVRHAVTRLLALPNLSVAWRPLKVEMAPSGDLAYVIGTYDLRSGDSRGAPLSNRGRLLEIWRKQTDGAWKCIVDAWNLDDPGAAPPPAPPSASAHDASPTAVAPAPVAQPAPPTPPHLRNTKYGDMPIHYQEAIQRYFQEHLKDPDSVQYREITPPQEGYTTGITGGILMREARHYGWTVKATIDAKDSHGRYVGPKSYTFLFRGEKIVDARSPLPADEMN